MSHHQPQDQEQRDLALDPEGSFLVQAPAGSGKTELLTQRFLKLLSRVHQPEEILAITFTRKAAGEMRDRIAGSLSRAHNEPCPQAPHQARTWELARQALEQDRRREWNLLENPSRLRIKTIDSFCLYLGSRLPLLSGMGREPEIMQDASSLYTQAAQNTLLEIGDPSWHGPLSRLLLHLDNDWDKVQNLLESMLRCREHWLRLVAGSRSQELLRGHLEKSLSREIQRHLEKARSLLGSRLEPGEQKDLLACMRFAGRNLARENPDSRIAALAEAEDLPGTEPGELPLWLGLAQLLLTQEDKPRKQVNKNLGFPPEGQMGSSREKEAARDKKRKCQELLQNLRSRLEIFSALAEIKKLPQAEYGQKSWEVLSGLLTVLNMAAAQLHLEMQRQGAVDYAEISSRALQALGEPDQPSDLLLGLDGQLNHILFDEYQDTSIIQQQILTRLVSGWTPGDGRTLFLVGDPMQSIYGFRDADVGVYLNTRDLGIGDIQLTPLQLSVNFRSGSELVHWVNRVFPWVFQEKEDPVTGSVRYSSMYPAREEEGQVGIHPFVDADQGAQDRCVLDLVQGIRRENPEESIAVLVRNRSHLQGIIQNFREAGLSFQAVEIDPLQERQVVLDLLSLTRALLNPGDQLAWLSVLRAPWCGLDLKDLTRLAPREGETLIPEYLETPENIPGLSQEGLSRLQRVAPILSRAVEHRDRKPISRMVEGTWMALGGPACCAGSRDLEDAAVFLDHLRGWQKHWTLEDVQGFQDSLRDLYSRPDPEGDPLLQLMTVHKAKGLEFDTVILPRLEKVPRSPEKLMLQFLEVPEGDGSSSRLLLAPIAPSGGEQDRTYTYIESLKKDKEHHEIGRLLYVAATRAKKRLHLVASAWTSRESTSQAPDFKKVPEKSFLSRIWDHLLPEFENSASQPVSPASWTDSQEQGQDRTVRPLRRMPLDWSPPQLPESVQLPHQDLTPSPAREEEITFDWAGEGIRILGTAVHELLEVIATRGMDYWQDLDPVQIREYIRSRLDRLGLPRAEQDPALSRIMECLEKVLQDPVGRWILKDHHQGQCEYALTGMVDGNLVQGIMDRTFVDEQGVRWIIDYKSGEHQGGDLERFLDQERERYREQIQRYIRLMQARESRKIRAGLYFPLLQAWREIEP